MQFELNDSEIELLRRILDRHLGDLRMEIGKTEHMPLREDLKADEALLKAMIARLNSAASAAH